MKKLSLLLAGIVLTSLSVAQADQTLVDLVKKVKPGVVLIETFDKDNKPLGQGSGFFVNNKGHIVTNHHVIEGAYRATVKTSSGKEYPVEGIIAKDIESDIIKLVVNISDANITFLKLSTNVPSEGEDIVVIGNPLGLESTISTGIVSAVRDIPAFGKILQITAPISPGSSGSPVINSKGEVIGIATLVLKEGQNLNFAIPSDKVLTLKESSGSARDLAAYADATRRCKITDKSSTDSYVWCQSGFCYLDYDFYDEAVEAFKQAIRIDPNDATTYTSLGLSYNQLGRRNEAIEAYKQAIRIKPDYASAYSEIGDIYEKINRHKEAIEAYNQAIVAFEQVIHIKSEDVFGLAMAYDGLGDVFSKLGRYEEAMEAYKQAIKIRPACLTCYNLGVACGKLGRYTEAADAFKQAIKIRPDFAGAHYDLGATYLKLDDTASALKEYKILKSLDVEKANKLFNLIYK